MFESAADDHASTIFPYGLPITRILLHYSIDLFEYPLVEVSATYNSKTFTSMGYVSIDSEWSKKDLSKTQSDTLKVSKSMSNPVFSTVKELEKLKDRLKEIKEGLMGLQESTTRLLQLSKKTSTDMVNVRVSLDSLK